MLTFFQSTDFTLRLLEFRHAGELHALVEADRTYFSRFQDWPAAMLTVEATREFLRKAVHNLAEHGAPYLGLYVDGALVGALGLNPNINWTSRSADVFYYIAERRQGRGYVTRACRVVVNYAFTELDLHRLTVWAAAGNTRSWQVAERLGFNRDGVHRDSKWLGDRYDDHYVYSLLRVEWEKDAKYQMELCSPAM